MYNSLLYMYSSLGDLPAAYALWAEFKSIGAIQPTSTSYGAIIRAFVDHGDLKMALELFRELDESSTRPMYVVKSEMCPRKLLTGNLIQAHHSQLAHGGCRAQW
jgi:pentatricopeptide repeat protein